MKKTVQFVVTADLEFGNDVPAKTVNKWVNTFRKSFIVAETENFHNCGPLEFIFDEEIQDVEVKGDFRRVQEIK